MDDLEENLYQRTVARDIECEGIGLHTGRFVQLVIRPAPSGHGLRFVRVDLRPQVEIPAKVENVVNTTLATTLGDPQCLSGPTVGTVEHLLAALFGLGVDNARIEVGGPEIPILDGSAAPFVFLLTEGGIAVQRERKRFLLLKRVVAVRMAGKAAALFPSREFKVTSRVDFDHPLLREQRFTLLFSAHAFQHEVARARTFGFLRDVEEMHARGLARGGSLDNAVVLDDFRVLNDGGLRYRDEFVRHKVLDAMGDLALLGMPIIAHFAGVRSGHDLNLRLMRKLLTQGPDAYDVVPVADRRAREMAFSLPEWNLAEA